MEDEARQFRHPALRFDEIQEQTRRQQAVRRMLPANEHLGAGDVLRRQFDFWLKHHTEFIALEGLIDVRWGEPECPVAHGSNL